MTKKTKTMRAFIKENRAAIDALIQAKTGNTRINDDDREQWILNDEGLYLWAKKEGVSV